MSIGSVSLIRQPYEDIVRLRQIAEVLLRNGLGFVAAQLDLTCFLPPWRRRVMSEGEAADLSVPQRLRRTIEELGPTFIKLGQILSTRPDLLPDEYIEELSRLLDSAPPVPTEDIREEIERELAARIEGLFSYFDPDPVAAASIGQVHRATLSSGEPVIVKIRRPGVERTVEADLDLLARQARFLEMRVALAREYRLSGLVDEFSKTLRDELDYTNEGRNADRLRRSFADDPRVLVPVVYWDLTTRCVITLEEVHGVKLVEQARLRESGYDQTVVAEILVDVYLKQIFAEGFFHADPHPANILVCGDDQIGFVDFGMVGYLSVETKDLLTDLLAGLLAQDVDQVTETVRHLGAVERRVDVHGLHRDIQHLFMCYYGLALEEVDLAAALKDVMSVAFRHRIHLPTDLAMLARTIAVLEGVARSLDPSLVLAEKARPFAMQMIRERMSLRSLTTRALRTLRDVDRLTQVFPRRLEAISRQLEDGELTVGVDVRHLQGVLANVDRVANRLSFSIIVAALIIGSAFIIAVGGDAAAWRVPLLGWTVQVAHVSFVASAVLASWLLLTIVRSRGF